ncbi:MAG TPA: glutamate--tRNA ligase [Gemmatimonadales bacterium]|jgi:glutamyl-tRNA synthetase|nr:glutamate--tRNA ligase [Gemmatimonadales bacterium]
MSVRVRFAPSPTGYLHVGGARTALFNWLFARKSGGTFLLRIEDTDKARSTDEHTRVILDGLRWLGLDWDEEPIFQGARVTRHQEVAEKLLADKKAYMEDGAIRLRVPPGELAWEDAVHGRIAFQGEDIKDFVILRADRSPLYNFAVVVDDIDMKISHVLRGDDHISNTPKQIAVYRALGAALPVFGHVPMIHGMDGKKLSKREGAAAVGDYQDRGILPEAMRNFLALLGWSPGGDREIMSMEELRSLFSVEGILKKPAVFDITKLEWMNGQYLSAKSADELFPIIQPQLAKLGVNGNRDAVLKAIAAVKTRSRTTLDIARQVAVRLDEKFVELDDKAKKEIAKDPAAHKAALEASIAALRDVAWTPQAIEQALRAVAEQRKVAAGKIFQPIRIALTGGTVSEPVNELLHVVGKEAALKRLQAAVAGGYPG